MVLAPPTTVSIEREAEGVREGERSAVSLAWDPIPLAWSGPAVGAPGRALPLRAEGRRPKASNSSANLRFADDYARCSPHSVLSLPRQRPARASSPSATGLVHGMQPMDG